MVKIGQKVRDLLTGFTGIITQRVDQLNGNVQFAIFPRRALTEIQFLKRISSIIICWSLSMRELATR